MVLITTLGDLERNFIIAAGVLGGICLLLLILVICAFYMINNLKAKIKELLRDSGSNYGPNVGFKQSGYPSDDRPYSGGMDNLNPRKLVRADSMAPIRSPPPPQQMGYDFNRGRSPPPASGPRPFGQMNPHSGPMGRNDFRNESSHVGGPRNPMGGSTAFGQPPRGDRDPHSGFSGRSGRFGY